MATRLLRFQSLMHVYVFQEAESNAKRLDDDRGGNFSLHCDLSISSSPTTDSRSAHEHMNKRRFRGQSGDTVIIPFSAGRHPRKIDVQQLLGSSMLEKRGYHLTCRPSLRDCTRRVRRVVHRGDRDEMDAGGAGRMLLLYYLFSRY